MAATFYGQESANRRNSVLLALLVVLVLAALGYVIGFAVGGSSDSGVAAIVIAIVIGGIASLATYYAGDQMVLGVSQAKEVDEQSAPELFDVVRELTMAAGLPMPRVYIIPDSAPNAFATGRDPKHASVAVTAGLLQKLDREELQGVIGHELSHVRNYDIRFSLMVGVLVGSIALLADFFLQFTFWGGMFGGRRGSNREGGGGGAIQAIMFVVAIILAILAPIAASLVQLAISRQREYLADASSVELTRNPHGLEEALVKISEDQEPLEVANRATQHLYIVNPLKKAGEIQNLFSTHPPIADRIKRLRQLAGEGPMPQEEEKELAGLD